MVHSDSVNGTGDISPVKCLLMFVPKCVEEEGGWEIQADLDQRTECILYLELNIYHDICWLHSQSLSPPTTSEARQDNSVGGRFLGRCGLICQGQDLSEVEVIHSAGPSLCE